MASDMPRDGVASQAPPTGTIIGMIPAFLKYFLVIAGNSVDTRFPFRSLGEFRFEVSGTARTTEADPNPKLRSSVTAEPRSTTIS